METRSEDARKSRGLVAYIPHPLSPERRRENAARAMITRRRTHPPGRFWRYIPMTNGPDACWEWMGPRMPIRPTKSGKGFNGGYGHASYKGRGMHAHRAAWLMLKGPIPPKYDVCHECDNRLCVNPAHLFVAPHYQNLLDCKQKGRHKAPGAYKLTRENVVEILRLSMEGVSGMQLAKRFGVAHHAIYVILRGKKWRDVPRPEGFRSPSHERWEQYQKGGLPPTEAQLAAIRAVQSILHTCECGRVVKGNAIYAHQKACRRTRAA
jgi:hypothetical protein